MDKYQGKDFSVMQIYSADFLPIYFKPFLFTNSSISDLRVTKSSINKMQAVQNMAAKITLGKGKYDSATRCLVQLYWLPIRARIEFKILSLIHRGLHGEALPYLEKLINYHIPTRPGLRSQQSTNRLLVPHTSKNHLQQDHPV